MRGHESHDATISFESIVGSPNSEVHRALILAKSKYLRKVSTCATIRAFVNFGRADMQVVFYIKQYQYCTT